MNFTKPTLEIKRVIASNRHTMTSWLPGFLSGPLFCQAPDPTIGFAIGAHLPNIAAGEPWWLRGAATWRDPLNLIRVIPA